MILIPHIIVGAVIGAKIQNFWIIAVLGIVSHFILDKIPHWDYEILKNHKIKFFFKTITDAIVGISVISIAFHLNSCLNKQNIFWACIGILFSLLPDVLWFISGYYENNDLLKKYTKFHHSSHCKSQKEGIITFLGVFSQVVVVAISLLLLFAF